MTDQRLTADEIDALQEVANIGMGQAGAVLANLLGAYVTLSVPRVSVIAAEQLLALLADIAGPRGGLSAVRQSFQCDIGGEAIVVYNGAHAATLSDLLGYELSHEQNTYRAELRELLFDVANTLIGACLCSVFEQLGRTLSFSRPSMIGEDIPVEEFLPPDSLSWRLALLVDVRLSLAERPFTAHILMLMSSDSMLQMKQALKYFLRQF